ncbi:hypothetical protein KC367_g251 [Hortaea werneckii]|nr:hypothetical protein KC367_g251 [Hortaea werneckii]
MYELIEGRKASPPWLSPVQALGVVKGIIPLIVQIDHVSEMGSKAFYVPVDGVSSPDTLFHPVREMLVVAPVIHMVDIVICEPTIAKPLAFPKVEASSIVKPADSCVSLVRTENLPAVVEDVLDLLVGTFEVRDPVFVPRGIVAEVMFRKGISVQCFLVEWASSCKGCNCEDPFLEKLCGEEIRISTRKCAGPHCLNVLRLETLAPGCIFRRVGTRVGRANESLCRIRPQETHTQPVRSLCTSNVQPKVALAPCPMDHVQKTLFEKQPVDLALLEQGMSSPGQL